jgi:hypothetical protein
MKCSGCQCRFLFCGFFNTTFLDVLFAEGASDTRPWMDIGNMKRMSSADVVNLLFRKLDGVK